MMTSRELFEVAVRVIGQKQPGLCSPGKEMLVDNSYWGPTPRLIPLVWPKQPTIERLAEIKAPTLIVIGDRDAPQILAAAETLNKNIKGSEKAVITGVSHHLPLEKPREYDRLVLKFLRKV
jgi:pimeloyl-ACP methyl ester carboxylesterase